MNTSTDVAVRNGSAPAATQAALAIKPGQTAWDKYQEAALTQIGLKDAPNADRAVFLHQCQRTGLDPFSRQIYMIGRRERVQGTRDDWTTKWTIQTGIDGWRVIRDRAERREGVRGLLSRFTYYDHDDNERKVWTRPEPPAAIEVTYTVRDRNGVETPYTSVLRHDEYVQTNRDGQPVAKWATMDVHMLEKCTEADVYRKAFPQDFSGIHLDDAMPPARPEDMTDEELDAAYANVTQRQRVTGEQIRQRRQTLQARIVDPETASPAQTATSPAAPATPVQDAGEAPAGGGEPRPRLASTGQVTSIENHFKRLGYTSGDDAARLRNTARLAGHPGDLTDTRYLTDEQAAAALRQLQNVTDAHALQALLDDGVLPGVDDA